MTRIQTVLKASAFALAALLAAACSTSTTPKVNPAIAPDKDVEAKVEQVLQGMTLEEKVGQMVQITIDYISNETRDDVDPAKMDVLFGKYKVGSVLNVLQGHSFDRAKTADYLSKIQAKSMEHIGIPCIYGLDMIHGASYLTDGSFYPQEINLGATFNRDYARMMGHAMAYETRAAQCAWVFSPVMDLGRDPRWPRQWESWGEDPYLQAEMARTETVAIQGEDPNHIDLEHAAVSIKHFMGYGCFQAGALTAMVNSASINGIPTHANKTLLTGWVKEQLNWDGMLVTDWADIDNLFTRDHVAADKAEAVAMGINAGIDMIMDPYDPECCNVIIALVKDGRIPMERVDDAVRRVLRLKVRLGLFDDPIWKHEYPEFASEAFAKQSYDAAVESEVLLKNEGILPLKGTERILVTGPNANSLRTLNGGWSYTWQGEGDAFAPQYNTILEAMQKHFQKVIYEPGIVYDSARMNWQEEDPSGIAKAVAAARGADVIIACVGENSYCETPGNMNDLNLSANQKELVRKLAATGKPVILVLNEGRPRIIGDIEPLAKAVIDVMLPSNYGADALAALLAGDENFSGKLDVQWAFGHGLSYTTFAYSDFKLESPADFKAGDDLKVSVKVTNAGARAGKEAVLLYSSDLVASLIPDVKRLRGFEKIALEPGETKTVSFVVPAYELAFVGADGKWRLEAGDFRLSCGGLGVMARCTETKVWETPNI